MAHIIDAVTDTYVWGQGKGAVLHKETNDFIQFDSSYIICHQFVECTPWGGRGTEVRLTSVLRAAVTEPSSVIAAVSSPLMSVRSSSASCLYRSLVTAAVSPPLMSVHSSSCLYVYLKLTAARRQLWSAHP